MPNQESRPIPESSKPKQKDKTIHFFLFGLLLVCFCYVHQNVAGANQRSRLDLLQALFEQGRFSIDAFHTNTADKAIYKGHYYSDKPPGTVVLAMPAFLLARQLGPFFPRYSEPDVRDLVLSWITCAGSLALVSALGAVALYAWLGQWVPARYALITVLGATLGGPSFPYATMLFPHAVVIGLFSMALWLAPGARFAGPRATGPASMPLAPARAISEKGGAWWSTFFAGTLCGMAVACEYTAGLAAIAIMLLIARPFSTRGPVFIFGSIPPLLLIPVYHWICFGTPFTLAYSHESYYTEMNETFYGIQFPPDLGKAAYFLFSPRQGFFIWSPIFLMALLGLITLYRLSAPHFSLSYSTPIVQVLVLAGFFDPTAGSTLGARYLACLVPLLALPVALGVARYPKTGVTACVVSIVLTGLGTIIDAAFPMELACPLLQYHWPRLVQGVFITNLGQALGLEGHWSILPWLLVVILGSIFLWRKAKKMQRGSAC